MESTLVPSVSSASHFEKQELLTCNAFRFRPKHDAKLLDGPIHPPWFGVTFACLLSQTFDCEFETTGDSNGESISLPLYVEKITFATGLPFSVTLASLIVLQRLYTRLPSHVFETRSYLSPQRLFTAAYTVSAKQHTQLVMGLDLNQVIVAAELPGDIDDLSPLSDSYWSQLTSYSADEIQEMQREMCIALGPNIAVFSQPDPQTEEMLKDLDSFPVLRDLPERESNLIDESLIEERKPVLESGAADDSNHQVPNFSRLTAEEQLAIFRQIGQELGAIQGARGEVQMEAWWMRDVLLGCDNHVMRA